MTMLSAFRPTIIIPIYNAYAEAKACIESVAGLTPGFCRVLLIDDGSTDKRISGLIREASLKNSSFSAFSNKHNLGYTATVNRGFRLACDSDVILLNSDTLVSYRWVEKLAACARSKNNVATVTPLSNAAGVFSVPVRGKVNFLPAGFSVSDMSGLVEKLSFGLQPCVPVGNGFCMYITRNALDRVGEFDEENFPEGYGSENDFCMRATKMGFIHRVEDSTFVYHRRSASFKLRKYPAVFFAGRRLRRMHPEHDPAVKKWLENDPLSDFRKTLKRYLDYRQDSQKTDISAMASGGGRADKIVFNSYNTLGAGPAQISRQVVSGLYNHCGNRRIWFLLPATPLFKDFKSTRRVKVIRFPTMAGAFKPALRIVFDIFIFPVFTWIIRADAVVVLANYSPVPVHGRKIVFLRHHFLVDSGMAGDFAGFVRLLEACRRAAFVLSLLTTDVILVQSNYMKQRLAGMYKIDLKKVRVLSNPASSELRGFSRQVRDCGRSGEKIVLYVSRFYPHKNHIFLLNLVKKYQDMLRGQNVRFIVTIDEKQKNVDPEVAKKAQRFISMVEKNRLSDMIVNIGEVPHKNLDGYYRKSDCLFFPSLLESFGNPVAEAMAYGLPVVVPDLGWARAVCGRAGIYYQSGSIDEAFEKIMRIIDDCEFNREYAQKSMHQAKCFPEISQWLSILFEIAGKGHEAGK